VACRYTAHARDLNAVQSRNLSEGSEGNRDGPRVRIFGVPVDIRT